MPVPIRFTVLAATMKLLHKILKSPGCRKIPVMVNNIDDVIVAATNFVSERLVWEGRMVYFLVP